MNPEQNQDQNQNDSGLSDNQVAASLGFITTLNQHASGTHPSQQQQTEEAPQAEQQPTQSEEELEQPKPEPKPEEGLGKIETLITEGFKSLKDDIRQKDQKSITDDINALQKEIDKLKEEDQNESPARN